MKRILLFLFFGLNLLGTVSCFNCESFAYFDYEGIELKPFYETYIPTGDSLVLVTHRKSISYLATNKPNILSPFQNSVYAMSCDKGFDGDKYPVTQVNFVSDTDFDANHPAGSSLNDLIFVKGYDYELNEYRLGLLNTFPLENLHSYFLYIKTIPEINSSHTITITIERTNGDIFSGTSPTVTWELNNYSKQLN